MKHVVLGLNGAAQTADDAPPSLAERYSRATRSSHLKLKPERCDLDYMIAAGWFQDSLGALLYRLRGEYDAARADLRNAEARLPAWDRMAENAQHRADHLVRAWRPPIKWPADLIAEPARIRAEARNYALTERALALVNLKTLRPAKDAFGEFAATLATRTLFMRPDGEARLIAGQVLDAWLDPRCHHCEGRAFTGGTHRGEQQVQCRPCHGSGDRRVWIGKDAEQRRFADRLTAELARRQTHIDKLMRRFLHDEEFGDQGDSVWPAQHADLVSRLENLRSTQANTD